MIIFFDKYYIFEKCDFEEFISKSHFNTILPHIFFHNSILYTNYSSCSIFSKMTSNKFVLPDKEDEEFLKNQFSRLFSVCNVRCFVGYYMMFDNLSPIGFNNLLKFWMKSSSEFLSKDVAETISFCNDSNSKLSFDTIPSVFYLPLVLKKI